MKNGRTILEKERFSLTLERLCHQLIEHYDNFEDTCLVGIQTSGVVMANRIRLGLQEILNIDHIQSGNLDITFYRDDFRLRAKPLHPSKTSIDFDLENKKVILVDDVLYTGRTIQAAMSALQDHGRPSQVEMLTLVDRRFNRHLPIRADYVGITVDSIDEAYVQVEWAEEKGTDKVLLFGSKREK
jgi:pyrimidine operon attenuation protein/uracil phosphoribosyltransferase